MRSNEKTTGKLRINSAMIFTGVTLALMLVTRTAGAQATEIKTETKPEIKASDIKLAPETYLTLYLTDTELHDANEVQTDLRNMIPRSKIYYLPSLGALSLKGSEEDIQLAKKIVAEVDRTKKTYRLTYTLTDTDGGKKVGAQHVSLVVIAGSKSVLKEGMRVPIVTGATATGGSAESSAQSTQVQYLDVGLNIDASLEEYAGGVRLRSKIEQSGVADEKSGLGAQDPVIRQTMLEGTSPLVEGKPLVLGTLDLPGSTRHQEVEVVSELVR